MTPDYIPFVLGLVGAAVPVALGAVFVRRKTKAETADIITNAAGKLITQMEARLHDLEERLQQAELRERMFMGRIRELETEIAELRGRPYIGGTA